MGNPNDQVATAVDSKYNMQTIKFPFRMYNKNTEKWDATAYINIPEADTTEGHFLMFQGWFQKAVDGGAISVDSAKLKKLGIPDMQLTAESLFQQEERDSSAYG
jgi:hypothetical protein